jgi:hypothetical protein
MQPQPENAGGGMRTWTIPVQFTRLKPPEMNESKKVVGV